jgi:hypothetical protein
MKVAVASNKQRHVTCIHVTDDDVEMYGKDPIELVRQRFPHYKIIKTWRAKGSETVVLTEHLEDRV